MQLRKNLEYLKLNQMNLQLDEIIDFITKNSLSFAEGLVKLTSYEIDLNLSPFDKKELGAEKTQEEVKMVEKQQPSVQHAIEELKDRIVNANQDKVFNNEVNIKKPKKVLLRVESKENVRSQERQKERSR